MHSNEKLEQYLLAHCPEEPALLRALNRDAHVKLMRPRMLSGHFQGRLLAMLSQLIQPRYILEIGTYTGYASICLSEGLQDGGLLFTIESDDEIEDFNQRYLNQADKAEQIRALQGNALELLPTLLEQYAFDLVYIDADKRQYTAYFNCLIDKLPAGSLILADNTLWDGKVLADDPSHDAQTQAIVQFNNRIQGDDRVEQIILPLRDGLSLIRVK